MSDTKRLLGCLLDERDSGQKKGRFRTREGARTRLGDDPYASVRAIARAAAGSLGPLPSRSRSQPSWADDSPEQTHALLLLRAMMAAAKADGEVDPEERARIVARMRAAGAEESAQRFVEEELAKPVDLYAITSEVRDAETAAEVYVASLAAIEVDTEAERRYLEHLASRLGLDRATVEELDRRFASPAAG